jgi:osomolarity two-component system, sensor histidine kinase NIK1
MASEATLEAITHIIHSLAIDSTTLSFAKTARPRFAPHEVNGSWVKLPGNDSPAKYALECELAALVARLRPQNSAVTSECLPTFPDTPKDLLPTPPPSSSENGENELYSSVRKTEPMVNPFFAGSEHIPGTSPPEEESPRLPDSVYNGVGAANEHHLNGAKLSPQEDPHTFARTDEDVDRVAALEEQLEKHQQANEAFQKALREIGDIITAVARGDLSKKVQIHSNEMDPGITTFKLTINTMLDQLQMFSSEVSRVAREVGTEGILGGQAQIIGIDGTWKELTENGKSCNSLSRRFS